MTHRLSLPLAESDPAIATAIEQEVRRQHEGLEMIASENFVSQAVLEAAGSVSSPRNMPRPLARQALLRRLRNMPTLSRTWPATPRAKGALRRRPCECPTVRTPALQANAAAYMSVLNPGDTILGLDLASMAATSTHAGMASAEHFSGKLYRVVSYGVQRDTEVIDYDELEQIAEREHPKLIIGGGSAYPRIFDFARMRQIADQVGALLLIDMAHGSPDLSPAARIPRPCPTRRS